MNLTSSVKSCIFYKYANFSGKATRSEYWWFWLVYVSGVIGLPVAAFILNDIYNVTLYSLMFLWLVITIGLLCPFMAVSVRRLHDSGLSGWHLLWRLLPYAGSIVTVVLMCRKSSYKDASNIKLIKNHSDKERPRLKSKNYNRFYSVFKKLMISLLITGLCLIGILSLYYFPLFILLFIYYEYLIWRKHPIKATDIMLLPILQRIGLYKNIHELYDLKKKLLVFASILVGTVFIAYCTFGLSIDDYDNENDGIIIGLFVFDLLAWVIFFFYEYGTQWLKNNESNN